MHWLTDANVWAALVTLTVLEIVLGIDNLVFIAILAGKLPRQQRSRARTAGLGRNPCWRCSATPSPDAT